MQPKKSLGQHWLHDQDVLQCIISYAEITKEDTVLEIGPGLGALTNLLAKEAKKVVAVEFDNTLAKNLAKKLKNSNIELIEGDILKFDLTHMPKNYKVVANIPYYITGKIIQLLTTSNNPPEIVVLLVQKEVAERLAAQPGQMSILGVSAQYYADVSLGALVKAELFTPPPKVDSQIVILKTRQVSLFSDINEAVFFRVVKAGFSSKRKKIRSSLSGGLNVSKSEVEEYLKKADIDQNLRAEALKLEQWAALSRIIKT